VRLDALEAHLREQSGRISTQTGPSRPFPRDARSRNSHVGWTMPRNGSMVQTGNPSTATTSGSSADSTATSTSQSAVVQFPQALQLCIETGKYTIELSELGREAVCSDGIVFERMRRQYEGYRNSMFPAWARFRKPDKAIFVKVCRPPSHPYTGLVFHSHASTVSPRKATLRIHHVRNGRCALHSPGNRSRGQ
jgi:hypothetical protein